MSGCRGRSRGCYCLLAFVTRFFTFLCILFSLLFLSLDGFCQPGAEIGVVGGMGYYRGEYNAGHFRSNQFYLGGLYRYNLNDRFALRLNAGLSKIDIRNVRLLSNEEESYPTGCYRVVADVSGIVEFNFRSFMVRKEPESSWWSPYIFAGVGLFRTRTTGSVSLPLGVGMKLNLYRQFSCGLEWGTRKLFTDQIDGLSDPWKTGETNVIFNKDWFFVTGITLTYRFPVHPECHF